MPPRAPDHAPDRDGAAGETDGGGANGAGVDGDDAVPAAVRRSRRLPILLALAIAPWTLVSASGTITVVLPFGLLNFDPIQLATIYDYYFRFTAGLPRFLLAWGSSVLLYALAVGSALLGVVWREDGRVTAALLVLAGVTHLWVSLGFLRRPGYLSVPVGTVLCLLVAWTYYRGDLRSLVWPAVE
jgi:uncharacterized protein (TIGR04206 family)